MKNFLILIFCGFLLVFTGIQIGMVIQRSTEIPRTIHFQRNRESLHYTNGVPIFPDSVRTEKYLYKGQVYQPSTSYYSITIY